MRLNYGNNHATVVRIHPSFHNCKNMLCHIMLILSVETKTQSFDWSKQLVTVQQTNSQILKFTDTFKATSFIGLTLLTIIIKFIWRISVVLPWIIWNLICLTQTNHHLIHFLARIFSYTFTQLVQKVLIYLIVTLSLFHI